MLKSLLVAALALAALEGCAVLRNTSTPDQYADDAALESLVRTRLSEDPAVPAPRLQVDSLRGVVQLSGYTRSELAKDRAGELARDVPGVREVRNDIVVAP